MNGMSMVRTMRRITKLSRRKRSRDGKRRKLQHKGLLIKRERERKSRGSIVAVIGEGREISQETRPLHLIKVYM